MFPKLGLARRVSPAGAVTYGAVTSGFVGPADAPLGLKGQEFGGFANDSQSWGAVGLLTEAIFHGGAVWWDRQLRAVVVNELSLTAVVQMYVLGLEF